MPKEYEYHEGKKAQEDFEEGMKALFQVPKDAVKGKKKARKKWAKSDQSQTTDPTLPAILGEAQSVAHQGWWALHKKQISPRMYADNGFLKPKWFY